MKIASTLLALPLLLASLAVQAQAPSPKAVFANGVQAYMKGGANAAINEWLKGSALEGNPQATSQANSMRTIEDFYGKPEGHEILSESPVSERSVMLLAVINFQKGPVYARFQLYKLATGSWVVTEFKVHTDATQLFPNSALFDRR